MNFGIILKIFGKINKGDKMDLKQAVHLSKNLIDISKPYLKEDHQLTIEPRFNDIKNNWFLHVEFGFNSTYYVVCEIDSWPTNLSSVDEKWDYLLDILDEEVQRSYGNEKLDDED